MARLFVLALVALALPAGSAGFAGTNGRLLGRTVAFVRGPGLGTTGDELVLREIQDGNERVLVSAPGIAAPDWSPDGSRIAAIAGVVNTIASGGSDLRTLTSG